MDERPSASIWGTILSCVEIGLNVYEVFASHGEGLMIPSATAKELLSKKALSLGITENDYVHFEKDSLEEDAAIYELIKNDHIKDVDAIERYGPLMGIEDYGRFSNPEYFGSLPEPGSIMPAWGERRGMTQLDNGVYFVAGESGSGIAVHNTVAEYVMSGHAHAESLWTGGNYRWFDLNSGAAIAMFELSSYRPKVLDLITSWESLMHTLAAEFPDYTDFWNRSAGTDCMIADMPAPSHMYLQWQLDQAMNQPALQLPGDKDEWEEQEDFYDPFDMPEI